jgi:hypothetical protein
MKNIANFYLIAIYSPQTAKKGPYNMKYSRSEATFFYDFFTNVYTYYFYWILNL